MTVWIPSEADGEAYKRYAPATLRNRDAILAVLREALPASGLVLEVASGSGEHAVHFAAALPALDWQPSDPDLVALASIEAWRGEAGLPNLRVPILLDAAADWPIDRADAILCINMVHISPWEATVGLFTQGARLLPADAPLILYGPYFQADVAPAPSNVEFDASLRARDPRWGIRALEDVAALATAQGFALDRVQAMPANNLTLIFRRS
ncbi:DUF938 domain-containing protein [Sphingobium sp. RAC03]|uniref:DUF938 domain-containing protein n=1 Tax=Sphingobium sp. RAC03 TaxID=1843368 RepID=UPI00083DBE81|nr:DUF938 domain-containing protein [Sphingobium sp. RAC03]AOF97955.1 hypothetical protein BSY17_2310 [Sphingobium sp. RAC03]